MYKTIQHYIENNKYELLISFLLFTNLFPRIFPQILYYISFLLILKKMTEYNLRDSNKTYLFYAFIGFLWLTTIIGMALDLRLVIFSTILFMCAPRKSVKWHLYKLKLLQNIFLGFGIATLANFYAKIAGINQIAPDEYMIAMGRVREFAGFCTHPMWTSAAGALSALFFTSMAFRTLSHKWVKWLCFAMIIVSLYIIVISGSRSAFVLALACSLLIIKMQSQKVSTLFRNITIIAIATLVFSPFIMKNAGAMLQKKNSFELTTQNTSRDELWSQRIAEFKSSPIIGIGFAAHGVGLNKAVGRNESGGGYISVLAQTGIVGICFVLAIWISAFMLPKSIGRDPNTILIYCTFVFMAIHSIVEGYMFQGGWYLCLVIWLIIGVMIEHKTLSKKYKGLLTY